MQNRRRFLSDATVLALSPSVPLFLPKSTHGAELDSTDGKILVVVEFDGGNDGINTVVPFTDEGYAKHRDQLRLPTDSLIKLTPERGLHPACRPLADMFQQGDVAVIQGVSYPNPDRSHFRSRAIWQSARIQTKDHGKNGWLGLALDQRRQSGLDAVFVGRESLPVALRGKYSNSTAIPPDQDDSQAKLLGPTLDQALREEPSGGTGASSLTDFVTRTVNTAWDWANQQQTTKLNVGTDARYPETELARRLKVIGQFVKSGQSTPVYYVMQSGYDTHANQLPTHDRLLREFSGAAKAFFDDLREASLSDRVLLLTTSEFGRRVAENNSLGTDHGTAGPLFLIGPHVRGGFVGQTPSLTDLQEGDLKSNIDFRQVYATVLDSWLGLDAAKSLAGRFPSLELV